MQQCNNFNVLILALLTFILFFVIAYRRPLLALSALAALLPTYLLRFKIFGLPSTILEVIIWGIFFGWSCSLLYPAPSVIPAIRPRAHGRGAKAGIQSLLIPRLQKIKYPLALFFIASIIAIFIAPDFISALGLWRAFFLEPILVFLMILAIVKAKPRSEPEGSTIGDKNDFRKLIFGFSISAFYLSAISIGQKFFGFPNPFLENPARASSVFPQPNMAGLYLAPIIILMIGQIIQVKKISLATYYLLLATVLSLIAIIFAQSDGAIVGVLAGAAIFCLLWNKKIRIFIIALIVLLAAFYLLPNNNLSFIKEKLLFADWSGIVRLQIWRETWAMLKDNWLFGAGIGSYPIKILSYHGSRAWMDVFLYPHNIIFNFWSELGLLGLGAFVWLLEKFGRMCYNLLKFSFSSPPLDKGGRGGVRIFTITAISAMIVIIVHGLVDVPYFKNDLSILFWIIYAMPIIVSSHSTIIPDFPHVSSRT